MRDISLEELLEAGCHFGHQVNRRNPKASEYIFEARSNIHIINLEKTREGLISAGEYLKNLAKQGGYVVFVGTKRQAKLIVKEEVERARSVGAKGIFYVTYRWIGGTLTNFPEVSKNFKKLHDLKEFLASGKTGEYTKREVLRPTF
jgi:small subunit ribosomal protein S2